MLQIPKIELARRVSSMLGAWKYFGPHLMFFPIAAVALVTKSWLLFALPILIFIISPAIELFIKEDRSNPSDKQIAKAKQDFVYDLALYLAFFIHLILVTLFLWQASLNPQPVDATGMLLTMGIFCGAIGINVAHELIHRPSALSKLMGRLLLSTTLYAHFYTEHVRGHHIKVATYDDPVTARSGEWVYAFWLRSITGGYISAWTIDPREVAVSHLIQIMIWIAFWLVFGGTAVVLMIGASLIGILLLETINYIEHYGMERQILPSGDREPVQGQHAWNSNHPLSRWFMFELTRHSDHHQFPRRPYQVLRHATAYPELPTGYPGMMALALIPPLWFRIMDPRIPPKPQA